MADTYTLISSVTVGAGGASSIDFTSIPSTYTDLKVVVSARAAGAGNAANILINFNGVGTNLSNRYVYGNGSSAGSSTSTNIKALGNASGDTANTFGNSEFYIPNYAGSTNKSVSADGVEENNATLAYQYLTAGLWSSTAAITQITLTTDTGNFVQYSTAYLYGIKNS